MTALYSVNPSTGETLKSYTVHSSAQIEEMLARSEQAFLSWRKVPVERRAMLLEALALELEKRKDALAHLMALEMGKVLKGGVAEIEKCAGACRYYAANGPKMLQDQLVQTEFSRSYVCFQPIGTILAIMPWNFPFWQAFRCLVPALLSGNAVVLKHASNVSGCALMIEEIVRAAGAPEGVFQAVLVLGAEVAPLIAHRVIKAISLTGSTQVGKKVASEAGRHVKKCVLELGGSDAYIICADADIARAARFCAESRLLNGGQSCIAAKRFIVVDDARAEFEEAFKVELLKQVMGDPLHAATTLGPQARMDLRDDLHAQVEQSIQQGAKRVLGGEKPEGNGAFYPPTMLTGVKPGMAVFDEETFGPVAAIIAAQNEEEAIALANRTAYGLGGGIFSRDSARVEKIAREELHSGSAFVNAYVRSDARLPFGGVKESGYGRELSSFGLYEFNNIKAVAIA